VDLAIIGAFAVAFRAEIMVDTPGIRMLGLEMGILMAVAYASSCFSYLKCKHVLVLFGLLW